MERINLDQAATSFPKPACVAAAMTHFINEMGSNVNRGSYAEAADAADGVVETREALAAFFGCANPRNVIFTSGITLSLNILLQGLLRAGDHVIATAMEHNAVLRPLHALAQKGVETTILPCDANGVLEAETLRGAMRPHTRAVVATHASNVCGTLLPIAQMGEICHEKGVFFIVDTAQTAGVFPLDMQAMHIDALAFTGHKGLLGPQGIGGFLLTDALAQALQPTVYGGTGSFSDRETMPTLLPDKFEAGTLNLPGIYGLSASLAWIRATGIDEIRAKEQTLTQQMLCGLAQMKQVRVPGLFAENKRAAVVSADCIGKDNAEIAYRLEQEYGILTRCGLHCAPRAHQTIGTFPQGSIRFSFGFWNTPQQVEKALCALQKIIRE
ncbi:MAG: aminotransferase class V-fold PLP-dependent enzyme [Ruthenibacterium sp.]